MLKQRRFQIWVGVFALVLIIVASPYFADLWVTAKYRPQTVFNRELWLAADESGDKTTPRQQMIRDLIINVLPGKKRSEIEYLLGNSPTHEERRRYTQADLQVREKDERGKWKPFSRTGDGYYFDENDWDLIYQIGCEQILIYDHNGQEFSPDPEYLMIRLNAQGEFESWYLEGSTRWPKLVGQRGLMAFRATRAKNSLQQLK